MKIAIYSRKSKFTGKGESVENQIRMCKEYIHAQKIKFGGFCEEDLSIFEDEGYSGKDLDRPQFQKMMALVRQKRFDYIICYRLDRISRSVSDFSALVETFNRLNVSLICIKEEFDTKTPMGAFMMTMLSALAQLERQTIAERVRDNMMMLARTGRWLGGTAPTGFAARREVAAPSEDGKEKTFCSLTWDSGEINTVRTIFTKYLELDSLRGVSKYLREKQLRSRNGKPFTAFGIKSILQNPVYCTADRESLRYFLQKGSKVCFDENDCSGRYGLIAYNKRDYAHRPSPRLNESQWIVAVGKHRGIISGRGWVSVQKSLERNARPSLSQPRQHNDYALFSGLLVCSKCHERMFAKRRSNNSRLFDYICSGKLKGGTEVCSCRNLNGPETDRLLGSRLSEYLVEGPETWKQFEKLKREIQSSGEESPVKAIERQIAEKRLQMERYLKALGQSEIEPALFNLINSKIPALTEQVRLLERNREDLAARGKNRETERFSTDILIRSLSSLKSCFPELTVFERRRLVRALVDRIEWDGAGLRVFLRCKPEEPGSRPAAPGKVAFSAEAHSPL